MQFLLNLFRDDFEAVQSVVQKYAISDGKSVTKVDISIGKPSWHLGILGMPGMTAYFGLLERGQPKAGETVFGNPAQKIKS